MSDAKVTQAFLEGQIAALAPFGFLVLGSASDPLHVIEASRQEGSELEVRVPGRPPGIPPLDSESQAALEQRGFVRAEGGNPVDPFTRAADSHSAAVELMLDVMHGVFQEPEALALNIAQGNRREEHDARQRLAAVAERIEKVLPDLVGTPVERDNDGDYVLPIRDVHVTVAPRIAPGGGIVVRIIAISNVGVNVTPELGLFLANLNFGLIFGRFALDASNRSIWVDESLLGDHFSDDELRFLVHTVAAVADDWDDRLKQMFGGNTHQEVITKSLDVSPPPNKPGQGLYL